MGLRRVLLFAEVLLVFIEDQDLRLGLVFQLSRLGLAKFLRPSRDEPAPVVARLATASR
jgi:hypothetical protein